MIEAKMTHTGQYKPYGDSYTVWEIKTDKSKEETVAWCFENLPVRSTLPSYEEFRKNTVYGGEKENDYAYYFAGYYQINSIPNGFKFSVCLPYCD